MLFSTKTKFLTPSICTWALSATLLWAGATQAQVRLSPMSIEVQTNRGQAQGVINITNTSNETFRARVYAEPFTYDKEKGFKTLPSSPSDLRPYLQFSPRELVVPPGTTRRVRLNARLAPSLPNGEYRTMIFTEPLKQQKIDSGSGATTNIITRVGTAFFVRKGNVSPALAVDNAKWNSDKKQIQLLVRNTGNASAYPSIKWTLKQGSTTVKAGATPDIGLVPQTERNIILNQSQKDVLSLTPGKYELSGELVWGEENKDKSRQAFKQNVIVPAPGATTTPDK